MVIIPRTMVSKMIQIGLRKLLFTSLDKKKIFFSSAVMGLAMVYPTQWLATPASTSTLAATMAGRKREQWLKSNQSTFLAMRTVPTHKHKQYSTDIPHIRPASIQEQLISPHRIFR